MWSEQTEKLIALYDDKLMIHEKDHPSPREIGFNKILYIDLEECLLYAGLNIVYEKGLFKIEYHTQEDYYFLPVINSIRLRFSGTKNIVLPLKDYSKRQEADWYSNINYKFISVANKSMMLGQRLVDYLMQPTYVRRRNMLLNIIFIKITYNSHLCMLTDNELILIRKEKTVRDKAYIQYAGTTLFIPYYNITRIKITEDKSSSTLQLMLFLKYKVTMLISYARENENTKCFVKNLRQMIKR